MIAALLPHEIHLSVMMVAAAPHLPGKESAVHLRTVENINRRHSRRFEAHRSASVRKSGLICDVEMLAEKTIDQCAFLFIVRHKSLRVQEARAPPPE
jgi:hypothetical protein